MKGAKNRTNLNNLDVLRSFVVRSRTDGRAPRLRCPRGYGIITVGVRDARENHICPGLALLLGKLFF